MRARKLLASAALLSGTAGMLARCHKELPGNPKGSFYDDAAIAPLPGNPKGSFYAEDAGPLPVVADAAQAATPTDAGKDAGAAVAPTVRPLPGNPKGSFYADGSAPKRTP
jgi:hypothetical protein